VGTNFYWSAAVQPVTLPTGEEWSPNVDHLDPAIHIGKRSAAGTYCWTCRITLCRSGEGGVHHDGSGWHKRCPKCGAASVNEGLTTGPAATELGFARPRDAAPSDVRGCCSFSWAQDPEAVRRACAEHAAEPVVLDEYGRTMTGGEFLAMLDANCPIQYRDSIGRHFC
jgi:hypothetical protein